MYFGQITNLFEQKDTAVEKGAQLMYKFLLIGSIYWVLSTAISMQHLPRCTAGVIRARRRV